MTFKSSKNLFLVATVVTILNFQSCKKYDDGPGFSLRSVTNRLTGEWEVVDISGQGSIDGEITMEFDKDGDFKLTYEYTYSYYGYSYTDTYTEKGDWSFEDGKETIEIDLDNSNLDIEFEIKRLTNSEFWFEDEDNAEWELEKI